MLKIIEQQENYVMKHRSKNMKKMIKVLRDSFKYFNGFFENKLLSGSRNNIQL